METTLDEAETMPDISVDEPMEEREENTCESAVDPTSRRNSTDGLVIGIAVGMVAGIVIGFLLRQMPVWIVGGILLGGAIGCLLDLRRDRRRKEACPDMTVAGEIPVSNGKDEAKE